MLITRECDYAVRVVRALAAGGRMSVGDICDKEFITAPFVSYYSLLVWIITILLYKFNIIFNFSAGFLIIFNSFFVFPAKIKD